MTVNNNSQHKWQTKKALYQTKGLTMVELVIALAIIGIISAVVSSTTIFGNKVFHKGGNRYKSQSDVNLVSENITNIIRYASRAEVMAAGDTIPDAASIPNNEVYIYTRTAAGGRIAVYLRSRNQDKCIAEMDSASLAINTAASGRAVTYNILGSNQGEEFVLNSAVTPQNMGVDDLVTDNTGTADGVALKLKYNSDPSTVFFPSGGFIVFNPATLPEGTINNYYSSYHFIAVGSDTYYTYTLDTSTRLPYGMSLSPDGELSGTPIEAGSFSIRVKAEDSEGNSVSQVFHLNIMPSESGVPVVANVNIIGNNTGGGTLQAQYAYYDPNGLADSCTYQWYIEATGDCMPTNAISGATGRYYTTNSSDAGKYIYLRVTPRNAGGNTGSVVFAQRPVLITTGGDSPPVAQDVVLTGDAQVGGFMNVTYTCSDPDGDTLTTPAFQWYRSSRSGRRGDPIPGATEHQYIVQEADANCYLCVEVTPVAMTGTIYGVPVLSASSGKIHN